MHVAASDRLYQPKPKYGPVKIKGPLYHPDLSKCDFIDDCDLFDFNSSVPDDAFTNASSLGSDNPSPSIVSKQKASQIRRTDDFKFVVEKEICVDYLNQRDSDKRKNYTGRIRKRKYDCKKKEKNYTIDFDNDNGPGDGILYERDINAKCGNDAQLYTRQRNLHPQEIVVILNNYHSMKAMHGKKSFCK